jgi:glycosyltransferase involved in cell wall biosynthesis
MNAGPTISVCLPVYNAERYVAEAVESILGQTFGDFELLIVDDGSTDGSRRILERYAAGDTRIRLVSRPNGGLVSALNEMLGMARGEFIARMDADDIALPERFERQIAYLRDHGDVVALGTRILLIDPRGAPLTEMPLKLEHEEIDRAHLDGVPVLCHPTILARTASVLGVGGYRSEYFTGEDLDLWLRLAEVGRLANLPEVLVKYRQHLQSIGNTQRARQEATIARAVAEARHRRGLPQHDGSTAGAAPLRGNPSGLDHMRKWAWWALMSGHHRTARRYALRSWYHRPLSPDSWRLVYCAMRGH